MSLYPENDYRYYLEHSAEGTSWKKKNHKYTAIINGRYVYGKLGSYGNRTRRRKSKKPSEVMKEYLYDSGEGDDWKIGKLHKIENNRQKFIGRNPDVVRMWKGASSLNSTIDYEKENKKINDSFEKQDRNFVTVETKRHKRKKKISR